MAWHQPGDKVFIWFNADQVPMFWVSRWQYVDNKSTLWLSYHGDDNDDNIDNEDIDSDMIMVMRIRFYVWLPVFEIL